MLKNDVGIVSLLLQANADPNIVDSDGMCDIQLCSTSNERTSVCTSFVMMHCQHCFNTAAHISCINKYWDFMD